MTARTHDMIALASLVTIAVYAPPQSLNIPTLFASLIANVVGSLIPDMDQASNRLWDLLPAGNTVGKVFRRVFISHRTISHSLLGLAIFYKLFEFILPKFLNNAYVDSQIVFVSLMIGIVSHLVADAMTKDGIPIFFPFRYKLGIPPLSQLRVRTDSWVENLVVLPVVVLYMIWFVNENQQTFKNLLKMVAS